MGTEIRVKPPIDQSNKLIAKTKEIEMVDTGCWFELKEHGQLRLHNPKTGTNVEFEQVDGQWQFLRVSHPILM